MTVDSTLLDPAAVLDRSFGQRRDAGVALGGEAGAVARTCRAMADRFRGGGRLLVFGAGATAVDAQHVAVEFLHPVIVGKRALPALALTNDPATQTGLAAHDAPLFAGTLGVLAGPRDIALGLSLDGRCASVAGGLEAAGARGLLTVAVTGGRPDTPVARAARHPIVLGPHDPLAVREVLVTTYHVVWELVHVFLERPAAGGGD